MEAMEATHKLFIFTLEALLLILTSSAQQQQQQCSDCGNTSVPYPLSTAPTCGDKSYKIRCDAGRLLFDTVNNTYPITSVNPTNQRLVIKPATLSSNDTCVTSDIVYEGIQLNSSLPFNITSSNTILYLNCTETLLQSPLNCTSASLCHVYANQTDSVAPCRDAGLCCTFRTGGSSTEHRIRVREAGCSAYTSFVNLDPNLPTTRQLFIFTAAALLIYAGCASSAKQCSDCGNTTVPYPLSTSPTCGDQSYKIRCDAAAGGGTLVFDTLNNTYPIASINPSAQRFVIKPATLVSNATCVTSDLVHQGLQLNSSLPFNVTSSNTILYLNCTADLLRSPLNCSSSSLCHVYANYTRGVCANAPLCCTFRAGGSSTSYMIRVRESGCSAYTSFVNLDQSLGVDRWGQPGLEIQWVSPREPVCGSQVDCNDGGGNSTCGLDPAESGVRRCFCNSPLVWDPIQGVCVKYCQDSQGCGKADRTALIAGLTSGLGATLFLAIIAILLYKRHRRIIEAQERLAKEREDILNASGGGRAAKLFTGKEIKKATHDFSKDRLLGAGGYGDVYKGFLQDGTVVAVKCAKLGNTKGTDQVLNEVRILCQVNHRSLVHLLGCCVELEQPILVYEYIENGALSEHLQGLKHGGRGQLTWSHLYVQRMVEEERIMDVIDPLLKEGATTLEMETMKALGFLAVGCLEERRQNRPSMKEVTEEIEYIISIAKAKAVEN
ncbi:wall-associated receptor kinase-like 20 [Quercus suber]|uniref:Wall-associated receptor kinase-like 20 n=1 Tax=Quercus suber TaxID=58331 RepID=A0AAW0KWQ9_QUESU